MPVHHLAWNGLAHVVSHLEQRQQPPVVEDIHHAPPGMEPAVHFLLPMRESFVVSGKKRLREIARTFECDQRATRKYGIDEPERVADERPVLAVAARPRQLVIRV